MSQTASFFTDQLLPWLLIACGCLGLVVVNLLGGASPWAAQRDAPASPTRPTVSYSRPATSASVSRPGPMGPTRPARGATGRQRPGVLALRPVARPARHILALRERQPVTDLERERLRVFLAAARPGPGDQVLVTGRGRHARDQADRVVALLRALGVPAEPNIQPGITDRPKGAREVMITIRKR